MQFEKNASKQILRHIHESGVVRGYELIGRSRKAFKEEEVVEAVQELKDHGFIENEGSIYSLEELIEAVISIHPRAYKMVEEELTRR